MGEGDSLLLCDNGGRHRRGQIVYHNDYIGGMAVQKLFKLGHDHPCNLVEVFAVHAKEYVGAVDT